MALVPLLNILFPHFARLHVERITSTGTSVRIHARSRDPAADCPGCGTASGRVHSSYERRVADSPAGGREVVLHLRVRRFFCDAAACAKKTFAEQVPGLTARYGRCTPQLRRLWEAIAVALGGRAGARLARRQGAGVSRTTLLRLVRALPDPEVGTVRVLGVDDVAGRKGHDYGTALVDLEAGRPVDLLADRSADTSRAGVCPLPGPRRRT